MGRKNIKKKGVRARHQNTSSSHKAEKESYIRCRRAHAQADTRERSRSTQRRKHHRPASRRNNRQKPSKKTNQLTVTSPSRARRSHTRPTVFVASRYLLGNEKVRRDSTTHQNGGVRIIIRRTHRVCLFFWYAVILDNNKMLATICRRVVDKVVRKNVALSISYTQVLGGASSSFCTQINSASKEAAVGNYSYPIFVIFTFFFSHIHAACFCLYVFL